MDFPGPDQRTSTDLFQIRSSGSFFFPQQGDIMDPMTVDAPSELRAPSLRASIDLTLGAEPTGSDQPVFYSPEVSSASVKRENPEGFAECTGEWNPQAESDSGVKMMKVSEEERALTGSTMSDSSSLCPGDSSEKRHDATMVGSDDLRVASCSVVVLTQPSSENIQMYFSPSARAQTQQLVSLYTKLNELQTTVDRLKVQQQTAFTPLNLEALKVLLQQENSLLMQYQSFANNLKDLEQSSLLTPSDMKFICLIRETLDFQMEQVTLYSNEASQALNPEMFGKTSGCCASLILIRSPFPLVLSKGKNLEKPVRVRLLRGTQEKLEKNGSFEASTTAEQVSRVPLSSIVDIVKKDEKDDDITDLRLKIINGSRMLPVTLKVSLPVKSSSGEVLLETLSSRPFVVITNESQFEDGNSALLRYLAFENGQSTGWCHFANALQEHFMRVTKQADLITHDPASIMRTDDSGVPVRAISIHELEYIHRRFFNDGATVTTDQFAEFWKWFGKVVAKMRSTKQVACMWRKGLLWAFFTRNEIENALLTQPPGTFVTRFSESNPGFFAIAYRVVTTTPDEPPVRHYLVKQEEISAQKTLPDLLCEVGDLTTALQVLFNDFGDNPLTPMFNPIPKNTALHNLCTRRSNVVTNGYDPRIHGVVPTPMDS